jgi:hypothetical protein
MAMNLDKAVKKIISRVEKICPEISFSYKEVNRWLDISPGDDVMLAYDMLSDRLTVEHSICLELKKDYLITAVPTEADVKAARKRLAQNNA